MEYKFTGKLQIASLNINGMKNKLTVLLRMLEAEKIDIIGIQETHFPGVNTATFNDYKTFCSGTTLNSWSGIAFLINKRMQKYIIKFVPVSDRCGLLYLNTNFRPTIIINFYVPPNRNERSSFVDSMINTIHSLPGRYNIIILGDFNMKFGKEDEYVNSNVIGHAKILQRNCEHSKKLLDFCKNNNFKIENTFFSHRESNTYTFVRAQQKSQIDFFISNVHRWFDDVKALTNINISDHRVLRANITVKNLWSYHSGSRQTSIGPNTNLSPTNITRKPIKVQTPEDARLFDQILIRKVANFVNITRQENVEACWKLFKSGLTESYNVLPNATPFSRKEWMANDTLEKINLLRSVNGPNSDLWKDIQKLLRRDRPIYIARKAFDIERDMKETGYMTHIKN
ncbi:uncharacterized protein LOC135924186 [Gordionus sp. m RMFG-2023]|uniref:uncharacterized protein LOC135924186 n=1 Tax=Gordionus sp. m RMFG-2023 TaxID=3053472 RepID=UPI0031FBECE4